MLYIYVLELDQNKYYVGKTNNINFRLQDHINNNGSAWTKKYKPIKLLELFTNCTDYHEDMYTLMYMDKFGIDNVRGGSYVTIKLDNVTINQLKKNSISTNNKCFHCGLSGHFVKSCPDKNITNNICERCGRNHLTSACYAKKDIKGNLIYDYSSDTSDSYEDKEFQKLQEDITIAANIARENNECSRCKRIGHYRVGCYETQDIYGNPIDSCIIS